MCEKNNGIAFPFVCKALITAPDRTQLNSTQLAVELS